jgi:hypothetical protein
MTLRNAFEAMATEATAAQLVEVLENLHAYLLHRDEMMPPRALQYARTTQDQMRMVVEAGTVDRVAALDMWNAGNYATWNARGGPNSLDTRELAKETSYQTFQAIRNNRWVIT